MRFLPREERFYTLFLDQVRLISEANNLLLNGLKSGNSTLEEAADQITALERKADAVIGEIFQRLGQTFITPIDAEDIHSLATRLDDVSTASKTWRTGLSRIRSSRFLRSRLKLSLI